MAAADSEPDAKKQCTESDMPGAFVCGKHNSASCRHKYAVPAESFQSEKEQAEACASAQLLHAVGHSFERWKGAGTKNAAEANGKAVAFQTVIHPNLPDGLRSGTARILGTTAAAVRFGEEVRSNKSGSDMNTELREGNYAERKIRGDRYDRMVIRNYFHHEGDSPDFCSLVEPDKNNRTKWAGKKWDLCGQEMTLKCEMRVRKGTMSELAEDYLNSETHSRWVCAFVFIGSCLINPRH